MVVNYIRNVLVHITQAIVPGARLFQVEPHMKFTA